MAPREVALWGAPGPDPALLATLAERVNRFREKYSGEMFRVDSRELELPGITTRMRPLVAPLVFYTLVFRPAAHNAAVHGYSLERRHYMWQFAC